MINDNEIDKNEIKFNKLISVKYKIIPTAELNFILESIFYIKKRGNIVGHPNTNPQKCIKLKKENIKVPEIKNNLISNDNDDQIINTLN